MGGFEGNCRFFLFSGIPAADNPLGVLSFPISTEASMKPNSTTKKTAIFILLAGFFTLFPSGCATFKGFGFGKTNEPEFREVLTYHDGFRASPDASAMQHGGRASKEKTTSVEHAAVENDGEEKKPWYGSGDSTFLMSSRAKEIHKNLER